MMSSNNYKISVFIGAVTAGSIGYAYVVSSAYADHPEKGTAITLFILVYIAIGTSIAYKLQQYVEEHRGNLWEHTLDQISKINTKRKELAQTDTAKKVKKNLQLNNLLSMRQDTFIALIYVSMASLVVALVGFFADWPFFVGLAFAAFIGMLWKHLLEKFENVYNGLLVATVPLILILLLTGSGLGWLVSSIFLGSAYYYIDLAIYDKADLLPKNHILQSESTDELSDERFWTYLTSIFICIAIILWHKFGYDPDVDGMLRGLSTVITSIVLTFTHGIVLTVSIDRKLLVMHRWLKKNTTNDSDQKEDSD
jgi:predicted PurR-regulated permease PerM